MTLVEQFVTLLIMIAGSFIIGVLFDGHRVIFNKLNISKWIYFIFDICFGILAAIFIFQLLLWSNNGQLRLIIFIIFFVGLLIYYLIFSKIIIVFWMYIFNIVNKVIKILSRLIDYLIINPVRVVFHVIITTLNIFKQIVNIFINFFSKIFKTIFNNFLFKQINIVANLKMKNVKKEGFFMFLGKFKK